ncbi:MAG: prepilin-type N-terminal cleavage/methylation domain-containing protein [Bordetella sp.]|nr:prepilin-type N-terminal cleavage/methylation domain-containing protein [Bordetella sp.]
MQALRWRRGREGFSLIEALVALAIASMTLMAIFELQIQMARSQRRAAQAVEQVAAQENALALTRSLNPMAQPQGRIELPGGDVVTWSAEPVSERRVNAGFPAGDGAFEVQLYRVTVGVERPQGRAPAPLVFDRLGWRRLELEG